VIIIAHRLSAVRDSDRILVLEHGRLVEQGAHNELLTNDDGIYTRLYRMQAA
jgi:subfamily B ATP-binding cassette protein HlyB/CyaB